MSRKSDQPDWQPPFWIILALIAVFALGCGGGVTVTVFLLALGSGRGSD